MVSRTALSRTVFTSSCSSQSDSIRPVPDALAWGLGLGMLISLKVEYRNIPILRTDKHFIQMTLITAVQVCGAP